MDVTLIEKGPEIEEKEAFKCYAIVGSEVKILRTICLGGTTMVSAGNEIRAVAKEVRVFGIDLSNEFEAAENNGAKIITDMPEDSSITKSQATLLIYAGNISGHGTTTKHQHDHNHTVNHVTIKTPQTARVIDIEAIEVD